ncbi:MAG: alpha/beta fold hydrolase [Candidatus Dormibacteraeota bacterium]|nr:alpha/beta fold hydrolase [Candidatus Dormibacteraeota bacterium]MBO0746524.1 alpha/beta fold hydrolase [Candidatus Dormibacteraeota bacterium]
MEERDVDTERLRTHCWVWGPEDGIPMLLVHGNLVTGRFWKAVAESLPPSVRVVAPDLRGFGRSEAREIDATRGLRDWSDDLAALVRALGWDGSARVHAAGWSLGGGVLQQYAIDHPQDLASLTLVAPLSPYGFGGTKDAAGTRAHEDGAGSGAGSVNPDFVRRIAQADTSADDPTSSPRVVMRTFFWSPEYTLADEDELLEEVLRTRTGVGFYPGDAVPSEHWPGTAPGTRGFTNAMAPIYCDTSAVAELDTRVPILWLRGDQDQVVSDTSLFDLASLGQLGAVPGWPGEDVLPPQPMLQQTRAVLERFAARGGHYREVVLEGHAHGLVVECPDRVAALLSEVLTA